MANLMTNTLKTSLTKQNVIFSAIRFVYIGITECRRSSKNKTSAVGALLFVRNIIWKRTRVTTY